MRRLSCARSASEKARKNSQTQSLSNLPVLPGQVAILLDLIGEDWEHPHDHHVRRFDIPVPERICSPPAPTIFGLPSGSQFRQQAAFMQDDWRISNRLTLNLGVRWEVRPPATETNNRIASFDLGLGKMVVASPGGRIPPPEDRYRCGVSPGLSG